MAVASKRRLAAIGAVIGLGLMPAPAQGATDWLGLRVLNIAHQGGEDEAPSNTIYAYERALRLGADMLEVDIHTTADGELVVLHDGTVDRTTNGTGRVYDLTLAEIQALDAGHNTVPGEGTEAGLPESSYPFRGVRSKARRPPPGFAPGDFRIPTLGEVMAAYPRVPINVEIKGAADGDVDSFLRNAEALAAFLNQLGRVDGVMVASFNDAAIQRFHELAPQIAIAPAVAGVAAYVAGRIPPPAGTAAFQVPVEFGGITVVDEQFVADAHADGYAVHVWTINEEEMMRRLLGWGVDGIMTAEPIRLERVLCAADAPRPPRPAALPGRRCNPRASIACDVEAARARLAGKGLELKLRRHDGFTGRCAGRAAVKVPGRQRSLRARFAFGKQPPPAGGPRTVEVAIRLKPEAEAVLDAADRARVTVRPYLAFADRARLAIGG